MEAERGRGHARRPVESRDREAVDFGYGPHDVVVLQTLTGERKQVILLHQVLKDELDRKQPRPGDLVAIRYIGRVQGGQDASGYARYRVEVDRLGDGIDHPPDEPVQPRSAAEACVDCGYQGEHAPDCPNGDDVTPF
jgi:hypothetical protein